MSAPKYVKFILLKRNPKISHDEYNQHWHTIHADILSSLPSFWKYIAAYVQNHILPPPECIGDQDPEFDGVAETTQRPRENIHDDFFSNPDYVNSVRPDELKLLSVSECVALCTEQRVIKDGPVGGVKLMAFIRPKDGMSLEEFQAYWHDQHAALVKDIKPFWNLVQRYVQNHVRPELSSKMISDGRVEGYGGVVELWFKSVDDFVAAWTNPEYVARIRPDEAVFLKKPSTKFLVEERPVAKPESLVAQ